MTRPSQCQLSCRAAAFSSYCRGPPLADSSALARDMRLARHYRNHTLITQDRNAKGTERAEGKIKGGGTSLARKAICTGVGGDTAAVSPGAEIVFAPQRHWLKSVPHTPYCDQLGGVQT